MRTQRRIGCRAATLEYRPHGPTGREEEVTILTEGELEALRLVDVEGMTQEEAAAALGVSRKTVWSDIKAARCKLVQAILSGHAIRIRPDTDPQEGE